MRRAASRRLRAGIFWVAAFAAAAGLLRAEQKDAVVELPPMVVLETTKGPPWYYLKTPAGEYLSRCSLGTTREFIQADMRLFQLLRAFVPDSLHARLDIPAVVVIDRLESKAAADSVLADMTEDAQKRLLNERTKERGLPSVPLGNVQMLLNLRLDDRDLSVLFAYLDEKNYDGRRMVLTTGYLRYLLERRLPDLPAWFLEGTLATFDRTSFGNDPITVRPFVWLSEMESASLLRDPAFPRALLPMDELFSSSTWRTEEDRPPRRVKAWQYQTALFVRWALDPQNDKRDALWKLAERATRDPITEQMFIECFGIGFSEMRDRLSDYLPVAVRDPIRIETGSSERIHLDDPRLAPREVVTRIVGEWQRLEIRYVKEKHPEFAANFAQEARRTLRKAYNDGDRDPQLLAALGLCEIDAGNPDGAPFFLKLAVEQNVNRPRAYFEVARMRFADLTRSQPPTFQMSAAETESVVAPLRRALQQRPFLPEVAALFANAWLWSATAPTERDFALMAEAARQFPARPLPLFRLAGVHAKYGRLGDANALLAQARKFPVDEQLQSRIAELQRALARPKQ